MRYRRWVIGTASSIGVVGLAATGGLIMLAHRFVNELSRPHHMLHDPRFRWGQLPTVPEPPSLHQRSLMFRPLRGPLLRGDFWAQPHPAPTVVICHGYRVSRTQLRSVAAIEYAFGYNVFLFDFRGHGESESVATSGGNAEVRDLQAALTIAAQQPETLPGKMILHGFSMGASIALLTPPHPQVAAMIVDSPYARLDEILRRIVRWRLTAGSSSLTRSFRRFRRVVPAVAWATVAMSRVVFRLRFKHALIARPDLSFRRWRRRSKAGRSTYYPPILLIHGMNDEVVPFTHARRLVAAARRHNIPLEAYFVDSARHCGAYERDPERYIAVLQQFLSRHVRSLHSPDRPALG